jgi:uncharacterized transporter YbjL
MLLKVFIGLLLIGSAVAVQVFGLPAALVVGGLGGGVTITAVLDIAAQQHVRRQAQFLDEVRDEDEDEAEEDERPVARGGRR